MTAYREILEKLEDCEDFNGSNVTAYTDNDVYKVFSYRTLIFAYDRHNRSVEVFDNKFYSSTTSKIQNLIIKAYKLNNGVTARN